MDIVANCQILSAFCLITSKNIGGSAVLSAGSVDAQEYEEQECEAPQRRSAVTEEGQGDAYDRA